MDRNMNQGVPSRVSPAKSNTDQRQVARELGGVPPPPLAAELPPAPVAPTVPAAPPTCGPFTLERTVDGAVGVYTKQSGVQVAEFQSDGDANFFLASHDLLAASRSLLDQIWGTWKIPSDYAGDVLNEFLAAVAATEGRHPTKGTQVPPGVPAGAMPELKDAHPEAWVAQVVKQCGMEQDNLFESNRQACQGLMEFLLAHVGPSITGVRLEDNDEGGANVWFLAADGGEALGSDDVEWMCDGDLNREKACRKAADELVCLGDWIVRGRSPFEINRD
jgi:hypothetical protein